MFKNNLYVNIVDIRCFLYGNFVFYNCYVIIDEDFRYIFFKNGDLGFGVYFINNDKLLGIVFVIGYFEINGKYEKIMVVCRINFFIEKCKVIIYNE